MTRTMINIENLGKMYHIPQATKRQDELGPPRSKVPILLRDWLKSSRVRSTKKTCGH